MSPEDESPKRIIKTSFKVLVDPADGKYFIQMEKLISKEKSDYTAIPPSQIKDLMERIQIAEEEGYKPKEGFLAKDPNL